MSLVSELQKAVAEPINCPRCQHQANAPNKYAWEIRWLEYDKTTDEHKECIDKICKYCRWRERL